MIVNKIDAILHFEGIFSAISSEIAQLSQQNIMTCIMYRYLGGTSDVHVSAFIKLKETIEHLSKVTIIV